MSTVVFTIGYQQRSIGEYIELLLKAGVSVVVDVREVAWSNRREYAKGSLSSRLAASGIRYVHIPSAGNPKQIRSMAGTRESLLRKYSAHVRSTGAGLNELSSVVHDTYEEGGSVAITCYERDACECHRSVLAKHLEGKHPGISVVHIP